MLRNCSNVTLPVEQDIKPNFDFIVRHASEMEIELSHKGLNDVVNLCQQFRQIVE